MKTNFIIQKIENSFYQYREYAIGGLTLVVVIIYFAIKAILKSNRWRQFLYSNGYTEIHFKTGKIRYPKVSVSKDKIVVKNCYVKSAEELQADKSKWEKFLDKKILSIEDRQGKTVITLEN